MKATKLALVLVALVSITGFASAETILINFGGIDASPDAGGDGSLTNWNEAVKNGTTAANSIVDSDGNTLTGVSVATADMGGISFDNSGTYASGGSVASWVDLDAIEIPWYNQAAGGSVTISGLTGSAYQVDLIAARSTAGSGPDRINDYYANGSLSDGDASLDWSSYVDGWQAGGVLTWSSVTPDAGVITMTDGNDTNSHWTAMRLTEVPEPASMSLLALGGLALLRRKRR